jgi:hypothetical protein
MFLEVQVESLLQSFSGLQKFQAAKLLQLVQEEVDARTEIMMAAAMAGKLLLARW